MSNLILDSLEIKGFRTFNQLSIKRVSRVNLLVGMNNVGKTSLLEALWVYANRADPRLLALLLSTRGELKKSSSSTPLTRDEWLEALKSLFYGRQAVYLKSKEIQIGPLDNPARTLEIQLNWYGSKDGAMPPLTLLDLDNDSLNHYSYILPNLLIRFDRQEVLFDFNENSRVLWIGLLQPLITPSILLYFDGLSHSALSRFWDAAILAGLEDEVLNALRLIEPEVERAYLVGENGPETERMIYLKFKGQTNPLPLRSLGDGMRRIFDLALAMVNCQNGFFLVDEIESNLHYTVQPKMWRYIFQLARRLNIQVFATTHSRECIEAFQEASEEDEGEEGLLVRLEREEGKTVATVFGERRLAVVVREQFEVR